MADQAAADVLATLLTEAQSPEPGIRQKAEAQLQQATLQPGFGHALVQATVSQDAPIGLRQMAGLLLKKHVRQHWTPEAEHFEAPAINEAEKAAIRTEVLQGLADSNSKIRTAVAMVVATIARWDVPDAWPSLLSDLVTAIGTKQNADLVAGAVRCLALFVDELVDEQVAQVVPVLMPRLLDIVSQPESYKPSVQRKAIAVFHNLVTLIINMTGPWKIHSKQLLSPYLGDWLQHFRGILARPMKAQTLGSLGAVKLEVLKAVVICTSYLGKLVAGSMPALVQQCWTLFVECLPIFESRIVATGGDADDGEVDSEGDNLDFETLISQIFEFLLTLAGSSKFRHMLAEVLDRMVFITIGYMQMTGAQADAWEQDVNQYVADEEEETFSVRTSGELLLDELMTAFPNPTAAALNKAVSTRFIEAAEAKAAGKRDWWKMREAALLAVGSVADSLVPSSSHVEPGQFQVSAFLENVLQEDLNMEGVPMFLQGRALWVAARMADAVSPQLALPFLQASASGISQGRPPTLQVGACRALSMLCAKLDAPALQPLLPSLYQGLGGLLSVFDEETLHLVLETLAAVIKADSQAAAQWEPHITPPMMHIWAAHVNDPMLVLDTMDVFEALAAVPAALPNLQGRALPVLASIASQPDHNSTILIEGALDLAVVLLRPSSPQCAAVIHRTLSGPVMALLRHHTDAGILQSCCEYLRTLISIGGEGVLTWGGADPDTTLKEILSALTSLLNPDTGDSAPLYVGQVVTTLIQKVPRAPTAMAELMLAAVAKLAVADSSPLIVALLSIFAQLVHVNATQLIDYLAAAPSPSGTGSALDLLLQIWTERALEFQGINEIKLSTTALAALLASRHPALSAIQVKGRRLDTGAGIRTRARARHQEEQWHWVPAPVKLFSLLADTLIEAREGTLGADEDDEWEEVSESEDGSQAPSSQHPGGLQANRALGIPSGIVQAAQDDTGSIGRDLDDDGPFAHIDPATFVCGQMRSLAQQDAALFESCCNFLSPVQLEAVQACLLAA